MMNEFEHDKVKALTSIEIAHNMDKLQATKGNGEIATWVEVALAIPENDDAVCQIFLDGGPLILKTENDYIIVERRGKHD